MSFLLAPKKELKKTSTPTEPPPIWGGRNCLRGQAALRQDSCMARRACALRASHDLFTPLPQPLPWKGRGGCARDGEMTYG